MKTNPHLISKALFLLLLTICFCSRSAAQEKIPKNYFGIAGIAELNRLAFGCGLEYERWFYTKNQFAIGAKAQYIFPSKTIDYLFSSNELLQRNTQTELMATSYLFTAKEKGPRGFFISAGVGVNFIKWEQEVPDQATPGNYSIISKNEVAPGFDISIGSQFRLSAHNAMRLTGGYQAFSADKENQFVSGNGISLLYAKISIGL